jgi:hypothetical protein
MTSCDLPAILDAMHSSIQHDVAAGFQTLDEIVNSAVERFEDEADAAILRPHAQRMVPEILETHLREQATWSTPTDCDRLDAAFAALEQVGIVCRQHFSCCGSCGAYEIWGEMDAAHDTGQDVRGYAFYHVQDTGSAVEGHGLYLNYGAVEDGEAAALAVAHEIVAALEQQGLRVHWDGQWSRRIGLVLDWKRRRAA